MKAAEVPCYCPIALCCSLLLIGSCGEKSKRYMLSHPHGCGFNMEPCRACVEKRISYIETNAEKQAKTKKQPPLAVLWHTKNRHTHIEREKLRQQQEALLTVNVKNTYPLFL